MLACELTMLHTRRRLELIYRFIITILFSTVPRICLQGILFFCDMLKTEMIEKFAKLINKVLLLSVIQYRNMCVFWKWHIYLKEIQLSLLCTLLACPQNNLYAFVRDCVYVCVKRCMHRLYKHKPSRLCFCLWSYQVLPLQVYYFNFFSVSWTVFVSLQEK